MDSSHEMSSRSDRIARTVIVILACWIVPSLVASEALASPDTLSSASYRLRAPTLAASGVHAASSAADPSVGSLHAIGGQSGQTGVSVAPVSGRVLEGGFHPAIRYVPEPGVGALFGAGLAMLLLLTHARSRRIARLVTFAAALLAVAASSVPAQASPTVFDYQGLLTDSAGEPIDGTANFTFRLYDGEFSGALLWAESHAGLGVVNGEFTVLLGSVIALDPADFDGSDLWLEVEVDGEVMTPRQRVATVPYAFRADDADRLEGYTAAQLDQSAHLADTANPHAVTAAQTGAVGQSAFDAHAADPSAHHAKTSSFGELTGSASDAQIPATIARDSEVMPTVLALDGAGSGLDADRVDGYSSSSFLRSNASDTYSAGTLVFNSSSTVRLDGTVRVGGDSASDDDVVYFDDGSAESIAWRNGDTRFEVTDELAASGPIRTGNVTGTPVGYNAMHTSATLSPSSNDMANAGDLFVGNDVEVSGEVYASKKIFLEGSDAAGQGGDQWIYFYANDDREGEYLLWNSFEGRFDLSSPVGVDGYVSTSDEFRYATMQTGYYRVAGAMFRKVSETALGIWSVDPTAGFGYLASGTGATTFTNISADVNLPHGATVSRFDCHYSDDDSGAAFEFDAYLRRMKVITGQSSTSQTLATVNHVRVNLDSPEVRTTWTSSISHAVVDNADYAYWIHVDWDSDTAGNWLHRFYGCRIEYETNRVLH